MRARTGLCCAAVVGIAGLMAAAAGPKPASAENLKDTVRTLNNVLNPDDARRLEDRARRNGRADEERYWRDYRAGLEPQNREREGAHDPRYRDRDRQAHRIGRDEAGHFEEQARHNRRFDEELYWHDYRAGLDRRGRD